MIEFFKKLFGQSGSSSTAKERLRLVLMSDHLALAPEIMDRMKHDLIEVISRYVEVDRDKVEVSFEREDRALAMLANIPIVNINRPSVAAPVAAASAVTGSAPPRVRRRRKKSAKANPSSSAVPTPVSLSAH